ncbi:hypothetical protein K439DRAFT_1627154 [Ramaria rubella]|nr:hypothetical protein K439DRAFT_1627154 [Ramaria rubella]
MPVAQIDDVHTQFFYQDSGVPLLDDKAYTTLVAVHGFGFNGHIFNRLVPLAKASHIRLVLLNRRGYHGSTPFSNEETSPIDPSAFSGEEETASAVSRSERILSAHYATFLQQRGAEMARFLSWFIDNEKIPPRSNDAGRASGGISLLGWSLGNVTTLSLLAFASTLDPGLMKKLEGYLRKVVIYDPPHHALGLPTPESAYNPLFDPEIPAEQRQGRFGEWVSSYFVHSPTILDPAVPLHNLMNGILEQRKTNPLKQATENNITPADKLAGLEVVSPTHGDPFSLLPHARPVHATVRIRAIFGNLNETSGPAVLPNVDISYIWATEAIWETVLAMRSVRDEVAKPPAHHYPARQVKFFALEGGNHFTHYDDPLKAFAAIAQALE